MIHILEPHGDDALISCFPYLVGDHPVRILTLGRSRSSHELMNHLPAIQDVEYADLYEIPIQIARGAYSKDYKKWRSNGGSGQSAWNWQLEVTKQYSGELWKESENELCQYLYSYLQSLNADDYVMAPIGITHPYHILLAETVVEYQKRKGSVPRFCYYSDAPYNSALWTRDIENSHPCVSQCSLREVPANRILSHDSVLFDKEEIFRSVYPTEVKLFRFTYEATIHNSYRFYIPS